MKSVTTIAASAVELDAVDVRERLGRDERLGLRLQIEREESSGHVVEKSAFGLPHPPTISRFPSTSRPFGHSSYSPSANTVAFAVLDRVNPIGHHVGHIDGPVRAARRHRSGTSPPRSSRASERCPLAMSMPITSSRSAVQSVPLWARSPLGALSPVTQCRGDDLSVAAELDDASVAVAAVGRAGNLRREDRSLTRRRRTRFPASRYRRSPSSRRRAAPVPARRRVPGSRPPGGSAGGWLPHAGNEQQGAHTVSVETSRTGMVCTDISLLLNEYVVS